MTTALATSSRRISKPSSTHSAHLPPASPPSPPSPPSALHALCHPSAQRERRALNKENPTPLPPTKQLPRTPPKQRPQLVHTPPKQEQPTPPQNFVAAPRLSRTPPKTRSPQEERFVAAPPPLSALVSPEVHALEQQQPPPPAQQLTLPPPQPLLPSLPAQSQAVTQPLPMNTLVVPAEAWLAMQAQLTALQTGQQEVKQYLRASLRLEHQRRQRSATRLQSAWRMRRVRTRHPLALTLMRRRAYRARARTLNVSRVHLTVPPPVVYAIDVLRPTALAVVDMQRLARGFLVRAPAADRCVDAACSSDF